MVELAQEGDGRRATDPARSPVRAEAVLAELPAASFTLVREFGAVPGFTITANDTALQRLAADPRVRSVTPDVALAYSLEESLRLVRADDVQDSLGFTGAGVTVAVIDSGIDTDHPDLTSSLAFQECFAVDGCPGGGSHTSGPGSAEDVNGHGTRVSGIVASDGIVAPRGMAPDASLGVYRIESTINTLFLSDVVASLDDILVNHPEVRAVTLSVSDNVNHSPTCDAVYPLLTTAINDLRTAGTLTFVGSGNNLMTNGLPLPACVSGAISVGGVWDANQPFMSGAPGCSEMPIADRPQCFSNSATSLDLLAPGGFTTTSNLGGGVLAALGTSHASPHAAGAAALLWEFDPALTPAQVETALETTGVPRTDPKNGVITPRIDAWAAIAGLIADPDADSIAGAVDNCPLHNNPGQENNDRNFTDLTPPKANDDLTQVHSDLTGDACDLDDDNDGLADTVESPGPPCGAAGASTGDAALDSDGDRFIDRAECQIGFDPNNHLAKPTQALCVTASGAPDANTDTDADGVKDFAEHCYYGSRPNSHNTDADACGDGREVASMDANTVVNAADLGLTASAFGTYPIPYIPGDVWRWNSDADKNGAVNAADLGLVAARFGSCP
jgi:subtilisin family serine protease